jgi:hypothetical protein
LKRNTGEKKKMHPNDHVLRALLDQELNAFEAGETQNHLSGCLKCQARFNRIEAAAGQAQLRMHTMVPGQHEQPKSTQRAYIQLIKQSNKHDQRKEPTPMFTRRPLWTALAVITLLALVFTLTPASAWASNFLGLFRVQKITVVQFDPDAAKGSTQALRANQEAIEQVFKENLQISEKGEAQKFDSAEAAAAAAGFSPRLPAAFENPMFVVQPGMQAALTIDREKMQALLDVTEIDFELPRSVDGEKVTVEAQSTILTGNGCQPKDRSAAPAADCTVLVQLPSPTINAPEGLNVQRLGEAMLQFLGLSKAEARALSQRIDWTTTLILPIPSGEGYSYQEVMVDGVTGTLVQEDGQDSYMLLWVKDGFLYGLKGPGSGQDALNTASTIQ